MYIVVFAIFIIVVRFHEIGYNEIWILDGILIPTLIFIFLSLVAETFVSDNRFVAVIGAFFVAGLCLIPGLKYQLFYGVYDSVEHYGIVKNIVSSGSIPTTFYAPAYSDTPGMHILLSSFVIVAGIPVDQVMKFVFPAIYGTIPLIVFSITNGLFEKNIEKLILIASTFPLVVSTAYSVTGSAFGLILYFLFLAFFLRSASSGTNKLNYRLVLMFLGFSLIVSHGVTSLFLIFLMIAVTPLLLLARYVSKNFLGVSVLRNYITSSMFLVVLLAAWWTFKATFFLESLANIIRGIFITKEMAELIPSRFYGIPLLEQLKVIALLHLKDIIVALMSVFGLCVFTLIIKRKEIVAEAKNFYLQLISFLIIILAAVSFEFVVGFGGTGYGRYMTYALVLSPFLVGLGLLYLDKYLATIAKNVTVKNLVFVCTLFVLFSLCLIEVFPYQPLAPRANVVSKDLPGNVYLFDVTALNTIYQEDMIVFAENFSSPNALIASDLTTRFQIHGFAELSFSSRNIYYSPLDTPNLKWDLFLLHTDEKAAPFNERAEFHTPEVINGFREEGNTVYDNGMSIILSKRG